ncbi:hypothetical protein DL766_003261 [Monosporascus sp. MC13-8B]|uniref:C2H2-type domain-containing protein n=1 Tax=Monosporascus cannonballus TaxID=155416 RepID=A0ABY0HB68_9PEZI|nr:hypothetical protein DL762_003224 [Monosporascus cannonballus]RYP00823.1 hypothetical protein DL763_000548 [Monosporascus cannonballus]RYP33820.1 hypothetical protein DL766_003261 [Monosporascus sp. MC13-8B]
MPTKSSSSVSPAELSAMSSYPGESSTYVSPASYVSDTVANHENPSTIPIHDQLPSNNNGPTASMYQVPSLGNALPHLDGSKDTQVYSHNSPWGIPAPGFPMFGHTTSQTEKQSPPVIDTNVLVPNTGGLVASIYEIKMQPQGFESSPTVSARTPSPWQLRQPSTEELKKLDCSLNPADAQYPSGSRPLINTANPPSPPDISPSTQSATSAAESTSPPGSEMAGTGRFRCKQCGFKPTGIPKNYGAYMRKHLRTHENPKIACECGKLFSRKDNATSHAKKAHRPQTPDTPPVKRRRGS